MRSEGTDELDVAMRSDWQRAALACVGATTFAGTVSLAFFVRWMVLDHDGSGFRAPFPFVAAFVLYVGTVAVASAVFERRRWARIVAWWEAGQPPVHVGRRTILREPWRQAASTFWVWVGGAALFATLDLLEAGRVSRTGMLLVAAVLSGAYVGIWIYLIAERFLRPVFHRALAAGAPPPTRLTVRTRLLLAWAAGSGIPLLGIGLALTWRSVEPDGADMIGPVWALVGTGLLAGWLVIGAAARSVTTPIEEVRTGLAAVESGRLDAEVPVDDTSEIGVLQSGFNNMVAGLRAVDRLREVFSQQVGRGAAQRSLDHGVDFDGEQVEASILFVDLIGSTKLAQTRPPNEVMRILNTMFEVVVDVVEAEGGWINKFQGDAALCVFGAPEHHRDHAARALRSAVAIRDRLTALGDDPMRIDAGLGVSSGTVVAGHLGSASRHEYSVIGDAANEAARLSDAAKTHPGRVLAAAQTVTAAPSPGWSISAILDLRGRNQPTVAHAFDHPATMQPWPTSTSSPASEPSRVEVPAETVQSVIEADEVDRRC